MANIFGTDNSEQIRPTFASSGVTGGRPTSDADWILAYGGNDTVWAGGGNDVVFGGFGNDDLAGDEGNDNLQGEDGNDEISGGTGADSLFGMAGNDVVFGDDGADLLYGGTGFDFLSGGLDNDTIYAEIGDDNLQGGLGVDFLDGGAGNDTITGDGLADWIVGGDDADSLMGGTQDNAQDTLFGGNGNDTLDGGAGDDVMVGGAGNDRYIFSSTFDWVWEGFNEGLDQIVVPGVSANNNVAIWMPENFETLQLNAGYAGFGNGTHNRINGNSATNILVGGAGNDTILGNGGGDHVAGGTGADLFGFAPSLDMVTIWDFEPGVDRILLNRGVGWQEGQRMVLNQSFDWGPHVYMELSLGFSSPQPNLKLLFVNMTKERLMATEVFSTTTGLDDSYIW